MRTKNIILGIAALAALASCSKNEPVQMPSGDPVAVRFTSNIHGLVYTRASEQTWDADDEIGIFMFEAGETLSAGTIVEGASNRHYTIPVTTGGFVPYTEDQTLYYPLDGSSVDFVAYYPYRSGSSLTYNINVADQTDQAAIDLLWSDNAKNLSAANVTAGLSFDHRLTKLTFGITTEGSLDLAGLKVYIEGMNTTADFSLADASLSNVGTPATIEAKVAADGTSAEAIVIPAAADAAHNFVFALASGETFVYSAAADAFEASTKHIYAVKLIEGAEAAEVNGDISGWTEDERDAEAGQVATYRVGEVFKVGGVAKGVIYKVTNAGRNGMAVSLSESTQKWSTELGLTYANSENDGAANMTTIQALADWQTKYPSFAWCAALGNGWYLPAINELNDLFKAVSAYGEADFNTVITDAGGAAIDNEWALYYSSTEIPQADNEFGNDAYGSKYLDMDANPSVAFKEGNDRVRAIYKF